jgi:hypothetical protein
MKSKMNRRCLLFIAMAAAAALHLAACSGTDDGDDGDDSGASSKREVSEACVSGAERPVCLVQEFEARGLTGWAQSSVDEIDRAEFEDGTAERAVVDACRSCE